MTGMLMSITATVANPAIVTAVGETAVLRTAKPVNWIEFKTDDVPLQLAYDRVTG